MLVTTTSITAVSVSTRNAQSIRRSPDAIHVTIGTRTSWPKPIVGKAIHDRIMDPNRHTVVINSAEREPPAGGAAGSCVSA